MRSIIMPSTESGCPYGKRCRNKLACPGVEITVSTELGKVLAEAGMDVWNGYKPEMWGNEAVRYAAVMICSKALQDPDMEATVIDLQAQEIET